MRISIAIKLLLVLLVVVVVPMAFTGWHLLGVNEQEITSSILEIQTKLSASLARKTEDSFNRSQRTLAFLRNTLLSKDLNFIQKSEVIQSYLESNPQIRAVAIVDGKSGTEVLGARQESEGAHKHEGGLWDRARSERGELFWDLVLKKKDKKNFYVFEFYLKFKKGLFIYARENPDTLFSSIASERFGGTGFAYLVDKSGTALTPSKRASASADISKLPLVKSATKTSASISSLHFTDPEGQDSVGSWAPAMLGGVPLWVMVEQLQSEAYAAQIAIGRRATFLLLIVIFLECLVVFWMAKKLSKPILTLTQAATIVAKGSFDISLPKIRSRDELGEFTDTFEDMTKQLKTYSEMQIDKMLAEKAKTEATVYSMQDGIVLMANGEISLINSMAKIILNPKLRLEDWIGKSFEAAVEESKREVVLGAMRDLEGQKKKSVQIDFSTANTRFIVEMLTQQVELKKEAGVETLGALYIFRDITLQKEHEAMKDDFVHMITHDLKSPLTAMKGYVEFLLNKAAGPLSEIQVHAISQINLSTVKLFTMVNNILDVFKLEHGKFDVKHSDVDLREIIDTTIVTFQAKAKSNNITLKSDIDANGDNWTCSCDPNLLERVLFNLVGNAMKYTPEEGSITIKLSASSKEFLLAVEDTGEGIPKEYLEKIFAKFGQIPGRSKGGTGLGLAITKEVVEIHNGKIWVESELEKGTAFRFTLPKARA
ncbi:ATP-binding protein [Elusimicrobiota bacterium]